MHSHEIIFGLLDIHTLKYKKQATNVYMSYNICAYRKTFKMSVSIHNAGVVNLLTFPSHPIHRWSKILLFLGYVCLSDWFMRSIMRQGATGIVLPKQHGFCSALYPQENEPPLGVLTLRSGYPEAAMLEVLCWVRVEVDREGEKGWGVAPARITRYVIISVPSFQATPADPE